MGEHGVGDRHIGRQRQRRVACLGGVARAEAQRVTSVAERFDFLFGRVDPRRAALCLGILDPPRELGEVGGQVGSSDIVVGELGAAQNDRALGGVELDGAVFRDAHGEHHRGSRAIGQQACSAFAQAGRVKTGLAVGQVQRRAAPPRLGIDRPAIVDEPADIGDRIVEQQVGAAALDRERLIEVFRRGGVKRDKMFGSAVNVVGGGTPRRHLGRCQHLGREGVGDLKLGADRGEFGGKGVAGVDKRVHRRPRYTFALGLAS